MITVAQATIDEQNPWPGLGSFDEGSERFFNGRRNESAELRRLVLNAPLTVLFGASGLGKTSLIQAGLFPQLRKEHFLPVYVRLDLRDRDFPLIEQVKFALQTQLGARQIDAPAMRGDELLWSYLHRVDLELWSEQSQLLTPLFVFDQFEEVFTLGAENPAAIARLRIDLADLIENRLPSALADTVERNEAAGESVSLDSHRYKMVLSFREDFLPFVESWKRELPCILRNRLRLLPMSGAQAFEAVHTTASQLVDESLARQIVRFVAAAQDDTNGSGSEEMRELAVEPALLSLVCHGLNEKRKAQNKSRFDEALLAGTGQSIISDYYQEAVGDFPDRVQRFIENELITERGFRKPADIGDARSVHGVTDQELRLLVDRRVLRIEPQRGTEHVELTHDLLTRVVREHRDRQRERLRIRRQRRRFAAFSAVGVILAVLAGVFGLLYVDARKQRRLSEQQAERADQQTELAKQSLVETNTALAEATKQRAIAAQQSNIANVAARTAEAARRDAELQARIATARRLATEALDRFEPSADGLATSGALAVESLRAYLTMDGTKALAQVLRLSAAAPEIIPQAHKGPVRALAFSHDGAWMASEGGGAVILWDVARGMKKAVLEARFADAPAASGLGFTYDGHLLAAGGFGIVSIWDTETGKLVQDPLHVGSFVRSVAFSPDGLHMAAALGAGGARLFQKAASQWQEEESFASPSTGDDIKAVIFPSNDLLAFAGTYGRPYQHGVWFWNLLKSKDEFLETSNSSENFGECGALSISQDSAVLAAVCTKGILVGERSGTSFGLVDDQDRFGISSDTPARKAKQYFAVMDGGLVHVLGNPIDIREIYVFLASGVNAFRPDGKTFATGLGDGSIALWPTTKPTASFRVPYKGDVTALAFSPDDRYLATAGVDETVRVFDVSDEAKIQQLQMFHVGPDLSSSTFSPDGSFLAVLDKTALHIIQTKPWRRLTQKDLVGEFYDASFSPDSRTLIALGEKKIHRFDTAMWQEKRPAMSVPSYRPTWQFSPDGRWLATYEEVHHGHGHTLGYRRVVWNLATGLKTAWKETDTIGYKAESPEGGSQNLIADSNRWRAGSDKSLSTDSTLSFNLDPYSSTLMLQDVDSKRTIAKLEHDGDVTDAAFSPHGRWLATSSKDGTVRLWPLQVKEMLEQACKLLPRNITPEEWTQFHMDGPYRKACPNLR